MRATGEWIVRKSAIHGSKPQQLTEKYNLPKLPTHVSDVHVPKRTTIFPGNVLDHASGQSGAIQYWINRDGIETEFFKTWLKKMRPL